MSKGLLASFEGQDAAGKSTILKLVSEELRRNGVSVLTVAEFSSTILGEFIKSTLEKNKFLRLNEVGPSAITETMYVLSDLYSQDELEIKPALQQGKIVLKERHIDSILACQIPKIFEDYPGSNQNQLFKWLKDSSVQITKPDLTFFLEVDEETLRQRIIGRGEDVAKSDFAIFRERQKIYDHQSAENQNRWLSVPNNGEPLEVIKLIVNNILNRINSRS